MKKYQKPSVNYTELISGESISSLNDWLTNNQLTDAGITTYLINS